MTVASQLGGLKRLVSGWGGGNAPSPKFVATNSKLSTLPTAFVYDHSTNAYAAAPVTGTTPRIAIPGLLPVLAQDDGALSGVTVTVTYPSGSAISGTGDFTIAALISGTTSDGNMEVFQQPSGGSQLELKINFSTDGYFVQVAGAAVLSTSDVGISDGRPHLVVLRRSSGTVAMFIDGANVESASGTGSITTGTPVSKLGTGASVLDEVAWWNSALTDAQIQALVSAAGLITSATGLTTGEWLTANMTYLAFSDFDIDTGDSLIDTPDISTGSAATVLADIAEAEDGLCFVNPSGDLVFKGRNSFGASVVTFGDGAGELPYSVIDDMSMDIDRVSNRVTVTKDGQASVLAEDTDSENQYGPRTLPVQAKLLDAGSMTGAADWYLGRYKDPLIRVDSVQVKNQDSWWATLFTLELGDRVTLKHRPETGSTITLNCIIEHIQHQIGPDDWTVSFRLAPMPTVLIFDDATFGQFDEEHFGW